MAHAPTPAQQSAISERTKTLLVSAGAGAGKTTTLTRRIIASLLDKQSPVSLSRTLVATFTTASAADLRRHIEDALTKAIEEDPRNRALAAEKANLPRAYICTLDSYFYKLLSKNAEDAGFSPDFRMADDAESALLKNALMDRLLSLCLDGKAPEIASGSDFAKLAEDLTAVRSERIELREVMLSLHSALENYPKGPKTLFAFSSVIRAGENLPFFETEHGKLLQKETLSMLASLISSYTKCLDDAMAHGEVSEKAEAVFLADIAKLKNIENCTKNGYTPAKNAFSLDIFDALPKGTKANAPTLCAERDFVKKELASHKDAFYQYEEDAIGRLCARMADKVDILCRFACKFDEQLKEEMISRRICDFPTLERTLLSLLENEDGTKTELARRTAASFDAIYVDEYQDINPIQHRIIEAISRENNRFMVGDVKQSIYGFRRAEPSLFSFMKETFPPLKEAEGSFTAAVHLSENFRSNAPVLDFINRIFDVLFTHTGKSIAYTDGDRLVCGNKKTIPERPLVSFVVPKEEAHELQTDTERTPARMAEAAFVAEKIKAILKERTAEGKPRYAQKDIAILLRTRTHADLYAKALRDAGIATSCADGRDFFLQKEILLCLCLLNTIDNPLRDIYLSGLMMSPIFAFSADEMMAYKAALKKDYPLWFSLKEYATNHKEDEKLGRFISQVTDWRALSETIPCDRLLRRLFKETGLLALSGREGDAGRSNLLLLYEYSRRFESGAYGGLHGFIDYINQMIEAKKTFERKKESVSEDAVQIISVHSSKGLEFPVCFMCESGASMLSKKDGAGHFLMHAQNLCALEMRDETGFARIENPLHQITKAAFLRSRVEEEIRVLYVALTRAKERLYITASPSGNTKTETILSAAERLHRAPSEYAILKSKSFFSLIAGALGLEGGEVEVCECEPLENKEKKEQKAEVISDAAVTEELKRRFAFSYPYPHLRALPAKLSVSRLTPTVLDGADEAAKILEIKEEAEETETFAVPRFIADTAPTAAAKGTATHLFLQFCDFGALKKMGVEAELARLCERKLMREEDADAVYKDELSAFAKSELFSALENAKAVYRELRFHVYLNAKDFTQDETLKESLKDEKLLVQGVIDLIFETKEGDVCLFDYKTDRLTFKESKDEALAARKLLDRHAEQLLYYKEAVSQIFGKTPAKIGIYSTQTGKTYLM